MAAILLLLLTSIAFSNASKLNYMQGKAYFTYSNPEKEGFVVVFQPKETFLTSTELYFNLAPPFVKHYWSSMEEYIYNQYNQYKECDESTTSQYKLTSRTKMTWDRQGKYYYAQLYGHSLNENECYGYKVEKCNRTGCYYNEKTSSYDVGAAKYCALDSQPDDYTYKCSKAVKDGQQNYIFQSTQESSDSSSSSSGESDSGNGNSVLFICAGIGAVFLIGICGLMAKLKRDNNAHRQSSRRPPTSMMSRGQPSRGSVFNANLVGTRNPLDVPASYARTTQRPSSAARASTAERGPENTAGTASYESVVDKTKVTVGQSNADCLPAHGAVESRQSLTPTPGKNANEGEKAESVTISMSSSTLGIANPLYDVNSA